MILLTALLFGLFVLRFDTQLKFKVLLEIKANRNASTEVWKMIEQKKQGALKISTHTKNLIWTELIQSALIWRCSEYLIWGNEYDGNSMSK